MLISRYTGRNSSLTIFKPVVKSTTTNMNRFFGASSARIKVKAAVVPRPETTIASTRPEPVLTDSETAVLPPLPPPLSSRFQSILTMKLKLIAAPQTPTNMEQKVKAMIEILNAFAEMVQNRLLTSVVRSELFAALTANIVRPIPRFDGITTVDESVSVECDCKNSLLHSCYVLLMRLQTYNPRLPAFSQKFALELLEVAGSSDPRERDSVGRFLEVYVAKHLRTSDGFVVAMSKYLEMFVGDPGQSPFRIGVILKCFLVVVKNTPMTMLHRRTFVNYVLPLLQSPHFHIYQNPLVELCEACSEEDRSLSTLIVRKCCRYWPRMSAGKQAAFMSLITVHAGKMPLREFNALLPKIFEANADCIKSPCATVTSSALLIWMSLALEAPIQANTQRIYPIIVPAILAAPKFQWNDDQRNTVSAIAKVMNGHNSELYKQLAWSHYAEGQIKQKRFHWRRIISAAADAGDCLFQEKVDEVEQMFPSPSKTEAPELKDRMPAIHGRAVCLSPARMCQMVMT